jgi:hypothetical protein
MVVITCDTTVTTLTRDVPDPDTGIQYPVKFRHPALSGINLPDI